MHKSDKQLVLAFFDSEAAADAAVKSLKSWDKATDSIKLGAVGILAKDEKGQIKQQKLDQRAAGKGVGTGSVLGIVAAVLSGGVTLLGGLVGGAALGGVLGSLFHLGLGLSREDLARLRSELDSGHAAVGVVANEAEVKAVTDKLESLDGKPEAHVLSEQALAQADAAAEEPEPAPAPAAESAPAQPASA